MKRGQTRRPNGTGTVYKRLNHAGYRAEVVINGRRRCFDAATREDAERRLEAEIYHVHTANELWREVVARAQQIGDHALLRGLRAYALGVRSAVKGK